MKPYRKVRATWGRPPEQPHDFLQANGRWQICGGYPYCRECNKERDELKERRRLKRLGRINEHLK